ncbi:MAG: ImmA/IrrE family metallo-endopeptidase, partial [Polyangiaceae bacterium]
MRASLHELRLQGLLVQPVEDVFRIAPDSRILHAANEAEILNLLVLNQVAAIEAKEPWALIPAFLLTTAETCVASVEKIPDIVAVSFGALDKPLKDLGDVGLVLRLAEACVRAADIAVATEATRRGQTRALICGTSWAKQRKNRLPDAYADAQRSLEMGNGLGWKRNTAFCHKCMGRMRRLEAALVDPESRQALFDDSARLLRLSIKEFESLDEITDDERPREIGACYSLLGRTLLRSGDLKGAGDAIESARAYLPPPPLCRKDNADLLILQSEFERRHGAIEHARAALSQALDLTDAPGYELAEMRARAYEQGALVAENPPQAAQFLEKARDTFSANGDEEGAARMELARRMNEGTVPNTILQASRNESRAVALRALRLADAETNDRRGAIAFRDAIPRTVAETWVIQARRQSVIQTGANPQVERRPRPALPSSRKRDARPLHVVLQAVAPGVADPRLAAQRLARGLVRELTSPPVDVEALAKSIGVAEIRLERITSSGQLRDEGGTLHVVLSTGLSRTRRRFTLAHELGHAILALRSSNMVREGRDLERFCDAFAGETLLPGHLLARLELPITASAIVNTARQFDASIQATAIRLYDKQRNFSAFAVADRKVAWSVGASRREPIAALPSELRVAIELSLERDIHSTMVRLD